MKLNDNIFTIDAPAVIEKLRGFILESKTRLMRDGILVPFSGGLDSSTVLLLCQRAVGTQKVTALLMPEKQGNPEAMRYARLLLEKFRIPSITRDISPILSRLGTYRYFLSALPSRAAQDWTARKFREVSRVNPFKKVMEGNPSQMERTASAKINSKHRTRAVVEYLIADEMNYLVVGSAHKSEDLVGLFVKFGVDDIADIMPLKNLYRSHILRLARALGVPEEICARAPNPDIIPGVTDKYMDLLGLPWNTVDLILYGLEQEMDEKAIARQLDLPVLKVHEIHRYMRLSEHMRRPAQAPALEDLLG